MTFVGYAIGCQMYLARCTLLPGAPYCKETHFTIFQKDVSTHIVCFKPKCLKVTVIRLKSVNWKFVLARWLYLEKNWILKYRNFP